MFRMPANRSEQSEIVLLLLFKTCFYYARKSLCRSEKHRFAQRGKCDRTSWRIICWCNYMKADLLGLLLIRHTNNFNWFSSLSLSLSLFEQIHENVKQTKTLLCDLFDGKEKILSLRAIDTIGIKNPFISIKLTQWSSWRNSSSSVVHQAKVCCRQSLSLSDVALWKAWTMMSSIRHLGVSK